MKKLMHFFDRLEDRVRSFLSHYPILYAIVGGIAIVLFWRGVWLTADTIAFLTGPVSVLISVLVLLTTGLFVSFFIGDRVVLSGMKGEKKLVEKAVGEIKTDTDLLLDIKRQLQNLEQRVADLSRSLSK